MRDRKCTECGKVYVMGVENSDICEDDWNCTICAGTLVKIQKSHLTMRWKYLPDHERYVLVDENDAPWTGLTPLGDWFSYQHPDICKRLAEFLGLPIEFINCTGDYDTDLHSDPEHISSGSDQ